MHPVDLLSPQFLEFLTALLLFAAAVISAITSTVKFIIRWYRRHRNRLRNPPVSGSAANHNQLLRPQSEPSAIQFKKVHPTVKTNNENHAEYQAGYQANKSEEQPLQKE